MSDFLTTSDGLALTKAFMKIEDTKLRQRILRLVEEIACSKDAARSEELTKFLSVV